MEAGQTGKADAVVAVESAFEIAQREYIVLREAGGARRSGIATVLGFNGVLIGLAVFATGNAASDEGVLAGTSLLEPFAWVAGAAIVMLALSALALLAALLLDAYIVLGEGALKDLGEIAADVEAGTAVSPTIALAKAVKALVGEQGTLAKQRQSDRRQSKAGRLGLLGTALGFVFLSGAGLIVVAEVISR